MRCNDCVAKLEPYVDRELSESEAAQVQLHLELCGDCTGRFKFQDGLKRLVRVSCCQEQAPAPLRQKVRQLFR